MVLSVLPVLACVGWVLATNPTDGTSQQAPCVFKLLTGWDCPFCGGTRMVWYLLHGDLGRAALDNAMALAVLPVAAYVWLSFAARRLVGRRLAVGWLASPWFWAGVGVVWVGFTVLRNIPAFSMLYA